jgi:hypothetical protein
VSTAAFCSSNSNNGANVGKNAGIAIGVILAVGFAGGAAFFAYKKRDKIKEWKNTHLTFVKTKPATNGI